MALRLASRSAARRAMLEAAAVPFTEAHSSIDEEALKQDLRTRKLSPRQVALALAEAKALAADAPGDTILGADQTLELADESLLDKATSRKVAREHLLRMSGQTHYLHSAAVLVEQGGVTWSGSETVEMKMRLLSAEFINAYVDTEFDQIRWCVGGYLIEGKGVQLFESIKGSHFAILGLPLLPLLSALRQRGILRT